MEIEKMNITRSKVLRLAVDTYGKDAQVDMMIEEMSELTKAICKLKRAQTEAAAIKAIHSIIEEAADVQIMLDQMRIIFGSTADVENDKIARLLVRLTEDSIRRKEGVAWNGGQLSSSARSTT